MFKNTCVHTVNGDFFKVTKAIRQPSSKLRNKKCLQTSAHKKVLNSYAAAERRLYLINENFGVGDLFITLTYKDEIDVESADKLLRQKVSLIQKFLKRKNIPFVYFSKTARGKNTGRVHHHLLIRNASGTTEEFWENLVKRYWTFGEVDIKIISSMKNDYLMTYFNSPEKSDKEEQSNSEATKANNVKFHHSRNMREPEVDIEYVPDIDINPSPYPNTSEYRFELCDQNTVSNEYGEIILFTYCIMRYRILRN